MAAGVNALDPCGDRNARAGGDDLAAAHDDGAALDRGAAVADDEPRVGDRNILCRDRGRDQRGGGKQKRAHHFTSPSPGCPSSKSLTGRRLGSVASNISAPSIQTFSGRV